MIERLLDRGWPFISLATIEIVLDSSINIGIIMVDKIAILLGRMRENPTGIRFKELCGICDRYFGPPRQSGGSHRVYRAPWCGYPNINIQNNGGKAKTYQVKQVLLAIEKLEQLDEPKG